MTKNAKIAKNKTKTEKGNIADKNSRKKQKMSSRHKHGEMRYGAKI